MPAKPNPVQQPNSRDWEITADVIENYLEYLQLNEPHNTKIIAALEVILPYLKVYVDEAFEGD